MKKIISCSLTNVHWCRTGLTDNFNWNFHYVFTFSCIFSYEICSINKDNYNYLCVWCLFAEAWNSLMNVYKCLYLLTNDVVLISTDAFHFSALHIYLTLLWSLRRSRKWCCCFTSANINYSGKTEIRDERHAAFGR